MARSARADEPLEVEVRGERIAAPPKEPTVAGSVIREERLRSPGLEASDVLRTQPAAAIVDTGGYGALTTVSVRGATAAQTPIYLAGIRLNDDVGGTGDLSLVPLWMIRQIEIYRSNAPIQGDRLGIGGAIFFEPRKPRGNEIGAGTMVGSFGRRALWARAGVGSDAAGALFGVRLDSARNDYRFVNDAGTRFVPGNERVVENTNADVSNVDIWALGALEASRSTRLDWIVNDLEREQGLPGLVLFGTRSARFSTSRRLAGLVAHFGTGDDDVEVTVSNATVMAHVGYDDPLREASLGTTKLDFDAARVEDAVLVRWSPSRSISLTPSVRASLERLGIDAAAYAPAHAERLFSRAALQGEWAPSDDVSVRALASAECHGTSLNGALPWALPGDPRGPIEGSRACNQLEPSARAGIQVGRAPLTALANVGRYARVPTLAELYGLSGAVRGNTALVPEVGLSAEIGVRASGSPGGPLRGASIDLFGFVRGARDLVSYERSSINYVRPFNVGSARVLGAEMMASYRPAPLALVELAATWTDARNTSAKGPSNDVLPYQPRLALAPRVELATKIDAAPLDSAKLSILYFYESSRYADPAGLVTIADQGSLDVDVEVGFLRGHVALRARLANLLDQTRFDLIGFPLPGRAAYAALEAQW